MSKQTTKNYKAVIRHLSGLAKVDPVSAVLAENHPAWYLELVKKPVNETVEVFLLPPQDPGITKDISCVKEIRVLSNLGLKESKRIVDDASFGYVPSICRCAKDKAEAFRLKLREFGFDVRIE